VSEFYELLLLLLLLLPPPPWFQQRLQAPKHAVGHGYLMGAMDYRRPLL